MIVYAMYIYTENYKNNLLNYYMSFHFLIRLVMSQNRGYNFFFVLNRCAIVVSFKYNCNQRNYYKNNKVFKENL